MKLSLRLSLLAIAVASICCSVALLYYFGVLKYNNPSLTQYPVRGVDVSSYQGDINWEILSQQSIAFAFIKATEGSSSVDRCFEINFNNALQTDLRVGAYHFFSFDSSGETQADNFIANVPKARATLPPVVDFEFYADKKKNPPNPYNLREELNILLNRLENRYEVKPIIYATKESYNLYLSGYYDGYDIWVRSVFTAPKSFENQSWTFWQYTNRERLDGYKGTERYIDMNVFNGTADEFSNYAK